MNATNKRIKCYRRLCQFNYSDYRWSCWVISHSQCKLQQPIAATLLVNDAGMCSVDVQVFLLHIEIQCSSCIIIKIIPPLFTKVGSVSPHVRSVVMKMDLLTCEHLCCHPWSLWLRDPFVKTQRKCCLLQHCGRKLWTLQQTKQLFDIIHTKCFRVLDSQSELFCLNVKDSVRCSEQVLLSASMFYSYMSLRGAHLPPESEA